MCVHCTHGARHRCSSHSFREKCGKGGTGEPRGAGRTLRTHTLLCSPLMAWSLPGCLKLGNTRADPCGEMVTLPQPAPTGLGAQPPTRSWTPAALRDPQQETPDRVTLSAGCSHQVLEPDAQDNLLAGPPSWRPEPG